ncbi:MAG: DUF4136 domain-containing protein [Chthoniobacter sp.]|nr:DUF4136 domain-containing protein [Chthoniobacter sp.]
MKTLACLVAVMPMVLLAACSTIATKRDMDVNADFDHYKTYAWAPGPKTQATLSPAAEQAIRATADQKLAAKGFTQVQGKTPDIYIVYHVISGQNTSSRDYTDWGFSSGYRPGYGFYTGWSGRPASFVAVEQDNEGALIVDMVEVHRNQLVWRGLASSVFIGKSVDDATRATKAVNLLLSRFPPPHKIQPQ